MGGAYVLHVVSIEVCIHRNAFVPKDLVVLRAGQRRQTEGLKRVERQLFLNDCDIASNGLSRIGGKAENIPRRHSLQSNGGVSRSRSPQGCSPVCFSSGGASAASHSALRSAAFSSFFLCFSSVRARATLCRSARSRR